MLMELGQDVNGVGSECWRVSQDVNRVGSECGLGCCISHIIIARRMTTKTRKHNYGESKSLIFVVIHMYSHFRTPET